MATKFVAPVIALALLVITSLVGKAPGKKACFLVVLLVKKSALAYVCSRKIVALDAQITREAEHAHSFSRCVIAECLY